MTEIWRDIPGYEGLYQVSTHGNVKSLFRYKKILSPSLGKYKRVGLSKERVVKHSSVHRLVAITFIPNPNSKKEVNHKDGNKYNNSICNLEWCTRSENEIHSYRYLGRKGGLNSTPIAQYDLLGNKLKEFPSQASAVQETNIPQSNIWKCCNGERKHAGGYKWAYV